jgi:ubiquitin carboxyl-terminal hydrolase 4/11/15
MSDSDYTSTFTRKKIDIKQLDKILGSGANHGVCGGHNLGNTCFMNSSIACLSNCTELTTYFLSGEFKNDINTNNSEGARGNLAKSWYELLEEYWNSSAHTGNPGGVKSVVGRKVRKFSGYSQQDSNEFMTEFLSILNEDLNKTDKKEYKELKEKGEDESELDCSKRFWNLHVKLNDSIVTDLFSGLFRSEVTCQNCQYKNITFDPFNTLTLAIPSLRELYSKYEFFYIPKYSIRKNLKIELIIKKDPSLKTMAEEAKDIKDFKYDLKKLKYIEVLDSKLVNILDENEIMDKKKHIFAFDDESKKGGNNKVS